MDSESQPLTHKKNEIETSEKNEHGATGIKCSLSISSGGVATRPAIRGGN